MKMTFQADKADRFLQHFDLVSEKIRTFDGCEGLSLVRDRKDERIFFTLSRWSGPEALESYRNSPLFLDTWSKVKPMFDKKAKAWSVDTCRGKDLFHE